MKNRIFAIKYNHIVLMPVVGVVVFMMGLPLIYAYKWYYTIGDRIISASLMNYGLFACLSGIVLINLAAINGTKQRISELEKRLEEKESPAQNNDNH